MFRDPAPSVDCCVRVRGLLLLGLFVFISRGVARGQAVGSPADAVHAERCWCRPARKWHPARQILSRRGPKQRRDSRSSTPSPRPWAGTGRFSRLQFVELVGHSGPSGRTGLADNQSLERYRAGKAYPHAPARPAALARRLRCNRSRSAKGNDPGTQSGTPGVGGKGRALEIEGHLESGEHHPRNPIAVAVSRAFACKVQA